MIAALILGGVAVAALFDDGTGRLQPFPSVFDPPEVDLSLIVPAYNEEERLPVMMDVTLPFLERHKREFSYEVIIVNDGSRDKTSSVALSYVRKHTSDRVRLLDLVKNRGKGGAVQAGMLHSRGRYLLMIDADGATDVNEIGNIYKRMKGVEESGLGVVVGSRAHLAEQAAAERKWYRNILMYGFNFLVSTLCVRGVRDTQCGFKLFTRQAAQLLFSTQHLRRWSFDVELLHVAQRLGVPIAEMGVKWEEIPGSKINVFAASFSMARDLFIIRLAYTLGIWRVAKL